MRSIATILTLTLAGACTTDKSTPPYWEHGVDTCSPEQEDPCTFTTTEIALDELTPLGFSAAEILALAAGSRATTFEWLPSGEVSDLQLDVTHDATRVMYYTAAENTGETDIECVSSLELGVRFTFATADGGFAENRGALLTALDAHQASLLESYHYGDGVNGSFTLPTDAIDPWLEWQMTFDAQSAWGQVVAYYSRDAGDAREDVIESVGVWPAGSAKGR